MLTSDCEDNSKHDASKSETGRCSDRLGTYFPGIFVCKYSIFQQLDGSLIENVPVLFAMSWSLAVLPHLLDQLLDNSVPALRIAVLVPSSLLCFVPLAIVRFDKHTLTMDKNI